MKKILFVIDNLGSGGAQNQLTMLAILLKSRGYHIELFYYYPQSFYQYRLDEAAIQTHKMEKSSKYGFDVVYKLTKLVYKNDYFTIISFLTTPNFYNVLTKVFTFAKSKSIISYRSSTHISRLKIWERLKFNFINSLADFIVFNSFHEQKNWIDFYPNLINKSSCIYNVVDLELFKKRSSYTRKNKLLVIGSVGPDKNGLFIIKALTEIRKKFDISLTWIGQKVYNLSSRKSYLDEMEKAIHSNKISDYWMWEEPIKNVEKQYHDYDALILASKVEGLPNVVCESLSTGTPVIISNVLDHPILVKHEVNGYLFDPNDANSLANAIDMFYTLSDIQYEEMGNNARKFSESTFSSKEFVNKFQKILDLNK